MKPAVKTPKKPVAAKMTSPGKITLAQAMKMYDGSPADQKQDLAGAKKLMAAHNKKVK